MIHCRINQRLLSNKQSVSPACQQVNEFSNSIDEAGGAPAAAAPRCPRPMPRSSSARNSRAGKPESQCGNWLLTHLCNESPKDGRNAELFSFHHLATREASFSGWSSEETLGDDSFMEMSPEWSSSRAEREAEPVIRSSEEPELKPSTRTLDGDIVSAIKNVVNDAVDSFTGDLSSYRDESMDSVADDLLSELEKAAAQVAGMEAEIKTLKERVEQDEVRRSHLEEELSFHKQADELAAHLQKRSPEQAPCTLGRHHCAEQITTYEQRLAFLENVCRSKDVTIMDLEQEISSLQAKLSDLFKDEKPQEKPIASSPPATIKELLFKLGSDHQNTRASLELQESEPAARKKLSGKKSSRKIITSGSSNNILVDLTPNLLDITNSNPAKKLKF